MNEEILIALKEWRDARRAIFAAGASASPEMWGRLANAEHRLMQLSETLK
jgi:hypothetical protein